MNIKKKKESCGLGLLFPSYRLHFIFICFSPKPRNRKKHSKSKETPAICFCLHGKLHDKIRVNENKNLSDLECFSELKSLILKEETP